MKIIALDPGVTTGFAFYWGYSHRERPPATEAFDTEVTTSTGGVGLKRWQNVSEVEDIWRQLVTSEPDVVVYEKFTSPSATRHKVELFPVQVIGVARLYCQRADVPEYSHTASMAKGFWTDKKIKKCGLWTPSQGHAMDATRHLLYHLTITMKDHTWLNMTR